jgi:hypothetical protein
MEAEVNSPVVELAPGESYAMDTTWYPTRGGESLRATTYSGVVESALTAKKVEGGVQLAGEFGVFYPGAVTAYYYGRDGELLSTEQVAPADPLQPLKLSKVVQAPDETARISLHIVDTEKLDRGPLGEAEVERPAGN